MSRHQGMVACTPCSCSTARVTTTALPYHSLHSKFHILTRESRSTLSGGGSCCFAALPVATYNPIATDLPGLLLGLHCCKASHRHSKNASSVQQVSPFVAYFKVHAHTQRGTWLLRARQLPSGRSDNRSEGALTRGWGGISGDSRLLAGRLARRGYPSLRTPSRRLLWCRCAIRGRLECEYA